jgi:UrcA family protein
MTNDRRVQQKQQNGRSDMFTKTTLAAVAAISLFAGLSTASAATPSGDTVSVTISYDDLDLNTNAGARAMFARITHAAGQICGTQPGSQLIDKVQAYKGCMSSITDRAVTKLGNARVSAVAGRQASTTMAYNSGR